MSPIFIDAIALTYRPDLDVLFLRWPQPVYAFPTRDVYQQVLELAQETKSRFWLFDIRSRGPLSQEDALWVQESFYPQLHGQLGRSIYVAYLLTPAHAEDPDTIAFGELLRTKEWYGQDADFEGFTSETDALQWLTERQNVEIQS
ncbi:hypothetical protein TH63_19540 [Rufibacter radiotolerans]|uniref:STAS/SEC14 domain-containing protein n=1 Tax=Rufibacter radiotolerans TaxID=1379910 RepID=A0A0H4VU53_9BACT|nr:hypothetical protein [Rufibacter radiotolerans]AKQ47344.1 hypothetical protein TH63_19540 [Rufibacter radiotolerans]